MPIDFKNTPLDVGHAELREARLNKIRRRIAASFAFLLISLVVMSFCAPATTLLTVDRRPWFAAEIGFAVVPISVLFYFGRGAFLAGRKVVSAVFLPAVTLALMCCPLGVLTGAWSYYVTEIVTSIGTFGVAKVTRRGELFPIAAARQGKGYHYYVKVIVRDQGMHLAQFQIANTDYALIGQPITHYGPTPSCLALTVEEAGGARRALGGSEYSLEPGSVRPCS